MMTDRQGMVKRPAGVRRANRFYWHSFLEIPATGRNGGPVLPGFLEDD